MAKKTSRKQQYEERTEALVTPIAEPLVIWIYDVEFVKEGSDYYLNVYIDKEDGVNIGDCETVSRALSGPMGLTCRELGRSSSCRTREDTPERMRRALTADTVSSLPEDTTNIGAETA